MIERVNVRRSPVRYIEMADFLLMLQEKEDRDKNDVRPSDQNVLFFFF